MAKDKDKDKKKNKNGGINSTPTRTFEVGGSPPGTVAIPPPGDWGPPVLPYGAVAGPTMTGTPTPPPHAGAVITGPKGTYGGADGVPASMINPVTGGLITTVQPLGDPKGVLKDKAKEADKNKYSDDPVLAFQQKEADRAREEEKKRKEKIEKGMGKIDAAFAGFNNNYYQTRENAYRGFYQPQINEAFNKAKENLTYTLARAGAGTTYGTLGSTAETKLQTEGETGYQRDLDMLTAKVAEDRAAQAARIADEKAALVSQLNATANADQAGQEATAKTAQLFQEVPSYNSFADIFQGSAQGAAGLIQAGQNIQFANTFNGSGGGFSTPRTSGVRAGGTNVIG
jgi:hypothetical protein